MHGLIDPFYDAVEDRRSVTPGDIWADHPVYLPAKSGLVITRVDPTNDSRLDFKVAGRTQQIYQHGPIHSLKLESSEGLVVSKCKRDRPVIILGGMRASDPIAGSGRADLLDAAICVPVYGADQFPESMRLRMRAYEFENIFYLPADSRLGFDEGFVRLDHAQPVLKGQLARHRGLALAEPALDALTEWFIHFVTGEISEESLILEYRREERAQLAADN